MVRLETSGGNEIKPRLLVPRMPQGILTKELAETGLPIACASVTRRVPTASEDWLDPMQRLQQGEYDWVVLSSVATARFLDEHYELGKLPARVQVAAVGSAITDAIHAYGGRVDLVGSDPASAETLVEALPSGSGNVLLPCAMRAAPTLTEGLDRKGYDVEWLQLYESVTLDELPLTWGEAPALGEPTVALITAGSVAQAAHRQLSKAGVKLWPVPMAFGKSSVRVLRELGWLTGVVCPTTNTEGVLTAYREIVAGLDKAG